MTDINCSVSDRVRKLVMFCPQREELFSPVRTYCNALRNEFHRQLETSAIVGKFDYLQGVDSSQCIR